MKKFSPVMTALAFMLGFPGFLWATNHITTPGILAIFDVQAENIIGSGAQIKWTTNGLSNSKMMYGTVPGDYPLFSESRCDSGEDVISHCVNVMGLAAGTVYYYRVQSRTSTGLFALSDEYRFASAAGSSSQPADSQTITVPAPPSGLMVTLAPNGTDVNFLWTDNSANESEFKIFVLPQGDTWTFLTSVGAGITGFTYFNHPTGTYSYHINACNSAGCSADSNVVTVTRNEEIYTPPPTTPPPTTPPPTTPPPTTDTYNCPSGTYWDGSTCVSSSPTTTAPPPTTTPPPAAMPPPTTEPPPIPSSGTTPPPPTITSTSDFYVNAAATSPKNNESGVNPNITIKVRFTKEFDPASTLQPFFSLRNAVAPAVEIPGNFQIYPDGFDFQPTVSLAANTAYSYQVSTTLRDKNGQNLASPFQSSFSATASAMVKKSRLEVTILDAQNKPEVGASYFIASEDFSTTFWGMAESNGTFQLDIPIGAYAIEIYPAREQQNFLRPQPKEFHIAEGETKKLILQFVTSIKLVNGTLVFPDGQPVTDAVVGAYSVDSDQWIASDADQKGNYLLRLGEGKWYVGIKPRDPATARWLYTGKFAEVEFGRDAHSQSKILNFTIPLADGPLEVTTVDPAGKIISDVAVIVDTVGGAQEGSGLRPPPEHRKSDNNGIAQFLLKPGTYYIRAFLPSKAGYFNPAEETVNVLAGQTIKTKMVFTKKEEVISVNLKGTTKLSDGTLVEAFVWGWSEKGGSITDHSNSNGEFNFKVAPHDQWHMGAGKEINGIPYKSGEITVEIGKKDSVIELVLTKYKEEVLSPPVSVQQSAAQQIVAHTKDGAEITLPPQAAAASGTVNVEIKPTIEAPSQAGAHVVSTVYDITIEDASGKDITQLTAEIEIVLPYSEKELEAQGVDENNIVPSYYDESTGAWIKVDDYTIDKEKNQVIMRVKHLTRFAIVAAADVTPPASPLHVTATPLAIGGIQLTWLNPAKDFDHTKMYRSEEKGKLGKIVNAEVKGTEFTDSQVVAGVIYYYVVRAVDPAGNESSDTEQIAAKALAAGKKEPASIIAKAFQRGLQFGSIGDDVRSLQQLLAHPPIGGSDIYPEGLVTGYFGPLTEKAIQRWQTKHNIVSSGSSETTGYGRVGPKTRAKLNGLLGGS